MNPELMDGLIDVLARRLSPGTDGESPVGWASDALAEGLDTPALVILAGLQKDSPRYDTVPWLDKVMAELDLQLPPADDLLRAYVSVVSRAFLAGRISADQALTRIHEHAVGPLGHPADLAPWCAVWEGLGPEPGDYRPLGPPEIELQARRLAAQWAARPRLAWPTRAPTGGGA